MLAALAPTLQGGEVLHSQSVTVHLGESAIAEPLAQLQAAHPEVDIGSYPFNREGRYGTTLVARATDAQRLNEVVAALRTIIVKAGGEPLEP
jgi:molybdopterin-biosynthesis enzyme MoeA-like protein